VRVVGKLDMIRHSTRSFALVLDDGTEVPGVLEDHQGVQFLGQWFGKPVLVLGRAIYRPSGSLLRVDTLAVESGEGQPALFSKVPPPRPGKVTPPRRAFSAYFGQWPGTESDAEWAAMLEEMRH
jgi:hypothetical protein